MSREHQASRRLHFQAFIFCLLVPWSSTLISVQIVVVRNENWMYKREYRSAIDTEELMAYTAEVLANMVKKILKRFGDSVDHSTYERAEGRDSPQSGHGALGQTEAAAGRIVVASGARRGGKSAARS